jgi:hypothetical protein
MINKKIMVYITGYSLVFKIEFVEVMEQTVGSYLKLN